MNKVKKIKNLVLRHKVISIILAVVLLSVVFLLFFNRDKSEAKYVLENAELKNITTYVTETGQVEAEDSITIQAKSSGTITRVAVKEGQRVEKGTLIAEVDSREAKRALEIAKLDYQKTVSPDSLSVLKSENGLNVSYDNGWNNVSSFVSDTTLLQENISEVFDKDGYLGPEKNLKLNSSGRQKVETAENSFYKAKRSFDDFVKVYKNLSRNSSREEIEKTIDDAHQIAILYANATKDLQTAVNYVSLYLEDSTTLSKTTKDDVSSWVEETNNSVNSLLSSKNEIKENKESLNETINPADEIDIKSALLTLENKQQSYQDCFIYAPIDGIVSSITAKIGESSGSSVGTIITTSKVAVISLNEVDVASIKEGQEVTLTFDALEDLTLPGKVIEIDSVGEVNSGVVTYGVKIVFSKDDARVKPGMSVNASIITNEKKNILTVSNNAVKTKNGKSYVEAFEIPVTLKDKSEAVLATSKIIRKEVVTGITDDTLIEIVSGLNNGDQIISKTVMSSSTQSTTSQNSKTQGSNNNKNVMGGVPPMGGSAMGAMMR